MGTKTCQSLMCKFCKSRLNKVVDKRNNKLYIRRRRECLKCGKRFTTQESIIPDNLGYRTKRNEITN